MLLLELLLLVVLLLPLLVLGLYNEHEGLYLDVKLERAMMYK